MSEKPLVLVADDGSGRVWIVEDGAGKAWFRREPPQIGFRSRMPNWRELTISTTTSPAMIRSGIPKWQRCC